MMINNEGEKSRTSPVACSSSSSSSSSSWMDGICIVSGMPYHGLCYAVVIAGSDNIYRHPSIRRAADVVIITHCLAPC